MDRLLEVDNFVCTLVAPRRSGKSHLVRTMLNNGLADRYDHIVVASPTLNLNEDYDDFIHDHRFTFDANPTPSNIRDLMRKQEKAKERCIQAKRQNEPQQYRCPKLLLVLDDSMDTEALRMKGPMDTVASKGRHMDIDAFLMVQKLSGASRTIRLNSDLICFFSPFSLSDLEQFLEQFVWREDRKLLRATLKELYREPYWFVALDNTERDTTKKLKVSVADLFVQNKMDPLELQPQPELKDERPNKRQKV